MLIFKLEIYFSESEMSLFFEALCIKVLNRHYQRSETYKVLSD